MGSLERLEFLEMETILSDGNSKLWGPHGFCENLYVRFDKFEKINAQRAILPLREWCLQVTAIVENMKGRVGVFISAEEDLKGLLQFLSIIPVIALDFPVFTDGRSYSKAMQLKTIHSYKGELRAVGDILIDQVSNMIRCGFDTLEVTHLLTQKRLASYSGEIFSGFYQNGVGLFRSGGKRIWRFF
ncbi:MAG: hypothetical protein JSC161_000378 [Candidatus Tokpelaia sp. JSC161]|jgi:uncharacterized protein (DUF934 family)|nr:MAG: hypothetical protein JSC161_000378 [Candidatus Tokpelaia sp. JSC161]